MTNKEIAHQLSISELTVNTHRKNAMRKLDIKNTAALVKFAIENNLSDL
jgi:two-component system, NarL family, response regulator DegU